MVNSDDQILTHALEFSSKLGLSQFFLNENNFTNPTFKLYILPSDTLKPVYRNFLGETHPEGKYNELTQTALEEQKKGYHTHIFNIAANSKGQVNRNFVTGFPVALEVMFHEGFHHRPRGTLPSFLEESAAKFIGLQAPVTFCNQYGYDNLYPQVLTRLQLAQEYVPEFEKKLNDRLRDLNNTKHVAYNDPFNNARIYCDSLYYGHFQLFNNVFNKIGSFRGFVELISGLPKEYNSAKQILEAIKQY